MTDGVPCWRRALTRDYRQGILVAALLTVACAGRAARPASTGATSPEAPPPVALTEPWTPGDVSFEDAGALRWAKVELRPNCEQHTFPVSPGILMIADEGAFERAFCRPSSVDWRRFRLALVSLSGEPSELRVVPEPGRVDVFPEVHPSCELAPHFAVLLLEEAEPRPLVMRQKVLTDGSCSEGYGY